MNNNSRFIWLNGEIVSVDKANINVLSPTSQFGINVFEGIRCYWNNEASQLYAFRLDEHYNRLLNSIKLLKLENNYSLKYMKESLVDVVKANNYKEDIAIRQTVFLDGDGSWSSKGPTGMFIAPIPKKRSPEQNKKGLKCSVSSWERINDNSVSPRIKVGANYINSRISQLEAVENGYDTTIIKGNNGKIAEAPGSCVFIVRDRRLITPSVTSSILESITRDTIITIANKIFNIDVVEREIDRTELYIADEVFLCGSAMEITPVISIDGYKINKEKEGEITKQLRKKYLEIASGNIEEYKHWVYPIY